MIIYGIKKNDIEYKPVPFENVEINKNENEYILNVSDYFYETIKLVLLEHRISKGGEEINQFIYRIDELEDYILKFEYERKTVEFEHEISLKSKKLMNDICNFLNGNNNDNVRRFKERR